VRAKMMNGQERVNRMFARRDQDRIPRHDSYWAETIERWQQEGLAGDSQKVLEWLESDFHLVCWNWPQTMPGTEVVVREDAETRDVRDSQGKTVRYWIKKSGTPEHLGFDCDSREKWERVYKPSLLQHWLQLKPDEVKRAYEEGRRRGRWCHLTGAESFEATRSLIGDEITMIALAEDPDWVADVSRTYTDVFLRNYEAALATGIVPDGLWIYGDMAYKNGTMCSPQMYREIIWPDHKRLADFAHEHGLKCIYHTDGDVNGVLDLYVAAGFDCLQPIEAKANMDIRRLCPKYGKQLAMFGNIDVMIMGTNDRDRIEEEIRSKFAAGMATKGYAYHSDHSVPPTVSWATYQFIIECVKTYGTY